MKEPTIEQLDKIRKEGYRPGVVACILHKRKLLMFYKEAHKLWQLPQGGINNKETYIDALKRGLTEELGETFVKKLGFKKVSIIDFDKMEFKPGRHKVKPLQDDDGKEITMQGKYYFFCIVKAKTDKLYIEETQFDQHFWVTFREAYFLTSRMYQQGKKRITTKVLNKLNELGLIE
ncbi:NUDIX domain-containing protein [Patescibacteria group bacterium]